MNNLTKRQLEIIEIIHRVQGVGVDPSLSTIGRILGNLSKQTIQDHLTAIERKGYLKRNPKQKRRIELSAEITDFLEKSNQFSKNILFNINSHIESDCHNQKTETKELIDGSNFISCHDTMKNTSPIRLKYKIYDIHDPDPKPKISP